MTDLERLTAFCDERTRRAEVPDFPPAHNGLQLANEGPVTRVGAAVDAGEVPIRMAIERGIDFLIVHHGLYWNPPTPLTGSAYRKIRAAMEAGLAVYSSHLPLDCHPEIGNNALLAGLLELRETGRFLPYEGTPIGLLTAGCHDRDLLRERLEKLFPGGVTAIEAGPHQPEPIGILTGSGASAVDAMGAPAGPSTLITGELKQHHFNLAQEERLNLYCCGHYRTEVFGVSALAAEVAGEFGLEWEFLDTGCPL